MGRRRCHVHRASTVSSSKVGVKNKLGPMAWVGLACYVIVYDVLAMRFGSQTLSSAFYQASSRWRGKVALFLFWGYLTSHLFRWTPAKYDLFRALDNQAVQKKFNA